MAQNTFKGGIHPYDGKALSKEIPIRDIDGEKIMVYPLSQHIGAPAKPIVEKGDYVKRGQLIAEAASFVSANIYSSCSGTVKGIEKRRVATGDLVDSIIIENDELDKYIQMFIKEGKSYPLARQEALKKIYPEKKHLFDILVSPNNILAYEYIRALNILKSDIKPVSIQRIGKDYNDNSLGNIYSSASGIRKNIDDLEEIKKYVPEFVFEDICSSDVPKFNSNMLDDILGYKLITKSDNGFCDYLDVNDDLSNKICNAINNYTNLEAFTMSLKSKDLTYTRIKRALLHILLNIKRNDIYESEKINYIPYIRILGFRKNSDILLHAIKENCKIPIISKMADAENVLDKNGIDFLKNEIRINDIYRILLQNECGKALKNEFVQPIVII